MILASKHMFWAIGNHLEPFSKVSDPPEGQEQGGNKVTILPLGLLQLLHPVLDLQMGPGLLYIVLNDFLFHTIWDKTIFSKLVPNDFVDKIKCP